jgi:hypothetical protein
MMDPPRDAGGKYSSGLGVKQGNTSLKTDWRNFGFFTPARFADLEVAVKRAPRIFLRDLQGYIWGNLSGNSPKQKS